MTVPIERQIQCVERELRFRRSVYARRVSMGTMPQAKADDEIGAMEAVLATLKRVQSEQRPQLFT